MAGPVEREARRQRGARENRRVAEFAVEIDRPAAGFGGAPDLFELRECCGRSIMPKRGDAEIHQLDFLLAGIIVAEGLADARHGTRRSGRR